MHMDAEDGAHQTVPSLLELCVLSLAARLAAPPHLPGSLPVLLLPEPEHAYRVHKAYERCRRRGEAWPGRQQQHLEALQSLAPNWRPTCVALPGLPACTSRNLQQLWHVSACLQHLQLLDAPVESLGFLAYLPRLTCLGLRGCSQLVPHHLVPGLSMVPQLMALELSGMPQLGDDSLAPALMRLPGLQVLDLSETGCGDLTLEALTYGLRLAAWATRHGAAPVPAAAAAGAGAGAGSQQQQQQDWARCQIRHWQLSRTHVSGQAMAWLLDLPCLSFLDVRGTGIPGALLQPLARKFMLQTAQGAVLTSSVALAAACINHGVFVCGKPEHVDPAASGCTVTGRAPPGSRRPRPRPPARLGNARNPSSADHAPATAIGTTHAELAPAGALPEAPPTTNGPVRHHLQAGWGGSGDPGPPTGSGHFHMPPHAPPHPHHPHAHLSAVSNSWRYHPYCRGSPGQLLQPHPADPAGAHAWRTSQHQPQLQHHPWQQQQQQPPSMHMGPPTSAAAGPGPEGSAWPGAWPGPGPPWPGPSSGPRHLPPSAHGSRGTPRPGPNWRSVRPSLPGLGAAAASAAEYGAHGWGPLPRAGGMWQPPPQQQQHDEGQQQAALPGGGWHHRPQPQHMPQAVLDGLLTQQPAMQGPVMAAHQLQPPASSPALPSRSHDASSSRDAGGGGSDHEGPQEPPSPAELSAWVQACVVELVCAADDAWGLAESGQQGP